jgi:hypothetical protein
MGNRSRVSEQAVSPPIRVALLVGGGGLPVGVVAESDAGDRLACVVVGGIRAAHRDVDAHVPAGGQPRYALFIGVE